MWRDRPGHSKGGSGKEQVDLGHYTREFLERINKILKHSTEFLKRLG